MGELSLRRLWVLMVSAFVDMVGFALILPLLPLYAQDFGVPPILIGGLLASFALAQLLTAPWWGQLSDRVGRRPVLLGSGVLLVGAYFVFALASAMPAGAPPGTSGGASEGDVPLQWLPVLLLFVTRILQGAVGGTIAVSQAYVSDEVRPDQRAQALGWITACTSAGVMIGPAIGSLSLGLGSSRAMPGLIATGFAILNLLFMWRWLPESRQEEARPLNAPAPRPLGESLAAVLRDPGRPAHIVIWVYASGMLGFFSSSSIMSLYLVDRFAVGIASVGLFYTAMGFVSVVMRALILGVAVRRLGEVRVLRLGIALMLAGLLLGPMVHGDLALAGLTLPAELLFLVAVLFIPMGTAFLFPTTTSLVSRYADPGERGQVHGVQQSFGGASRLVAPILAGAAYQLCPPASGWPFGGALPFWLSALILLGTGVLAMRVRPEPEALPASPPSPGVAEAKT